MALKTHTAQLTTKVYISGSFGDSVVSCDIFLDTVYMGECFAEKRHMDFIWKHGKGAYDILIE